MKIRTLIICLLASSVLAQPVGAEQKPKPGPVKVDDKSVRLVRQNLGFKLEDDSIRALANVALADLIEIKEPEAPDQAIPEQAVFVRLDKKSYLFQMISSSRRSRRSG